MSRVVEKVAPCPRCNSPIRANVYASVNVTVDPQLRDKVLNRQINHAACAKCGQTVTIGGNLLYHDSGKKFMVWLQLGEFRETGNEDPPAIAQLGKAVFGNYRLRIATGWAQFIERIVILEAGLNEGIIELIKVIVWPNTPGNENHEYVDGAIQLVNFFTVPNSPWELHFTYTLGAESLFFKFPQSRYESIAADADVRKFHLENGKWLCIDMNFVRNNWTGS